jgi:hypothetical protein
MKLRGHIPLMLKIWHIKWYTLTHPLLLGGYEYGGLESCNVGHTGLDEM